MLRESFLKELYIEKTKNIMQRLKILVPVDFSPLSENVVTFSLELAKAIHADITLLHVVDTTIISAEGLWLDSVEAAYQAANARIEAFARQHTPIQQKGVKWIVRFGVAGYTIADVARDTDMNYVVCGMQNKHGFMERWLGTTSYTVIKQSPCPVYLVHGHTIWLKPQNIFLACQDAHSLRLAWPEFLKMNFSHKANTKILHVQAGQTEQAEKVIAHDLDQYVKQLQAPFPVEFKILQDDAVVETIVDNAILEKADLLVVIHQGKEHWPWQSANSVSVKMAESLHLPILVLPLPPQSSNH